MKSVQQLKNSEICDINQAPSEKRSTSVKKYYHSLIIETLVLHAGVISTLLAVLFNEFLIAWLDPTPPLGRLSTRFSKNENCPPAQIPAGFLFEGGTEFERRGLASIIGKE